LCLKEYPVGRTRSTSLAPERQDHETAAEIAALIAAGSTPSAIALVLLPLLPAALLRTPDLAAGAAESAAGLVLVNPPETPARSEGARSAAAVENLIYRGFYAIAAARRLGSALLGDPGDIPATERLREALKKEAGHLGAHREASERRRKAAAMVDGAAALYGPVLSWNHGAPERPRPNHAAADGFNFRADRSPPAFTGAYPGALPGCTCLPGPPRPGARLLNY
jgi:hypothetical protein